MSVWSGEKTNSKAVQEKKMIRDQGVIGVWEEMVRLWWEKITSVWPGSGWAFQVRYFRVRVLYFTLFSIRDFNSLLYSSIYKLYFRFPCIYIFLDIICCTCLYNIKCLQILYQFLLEMSTTSAHKEVSGLCLKTEAIWETYRMLYAYKPIVYHINRYDYM